MDYAVTIDAEQQAKPWMVMVHGMSQDHRVFDRQVETFRAKYRFLLIDLPGHGLASEVGGPLGHAEVADQVREAMAHHGVERPAYWGTHTGAGVGLYLAATQPGIFPGLVLEGPVIPGTNPPIAREVLGRVKATAKQGGLAAAIDLWWREGPWFDHMRAHPEQGRAEEHLAIIKDFKGRPWIEEWPAGRPIENIESALARINTPVLIYNGSDDHPDFLATADHLESLLPKSRRTSIKGSGGFPAWENPSTTNTYVALFLAAT